ncbi:MAG: hypothetical protein WAV98_00705 [Minisyncoccia bacterium]
MKKILISGVVLMVGFLSFAVMVEAKTVRVKGYVKPSTGTYVAPHYKTSPNRTKADNYSTKGNYNPYSGKKGTVKVYKY